MKIHILLLLIATAVIGFSLFNTYSIKTYSARAESLSGCVTSDNRTGNEYVSVQCLEIPATKLTVCNILGTDLMAYNAVGCGSSSNSLHIHPSTSSSGGHGHHGNHHEGVLVLAIYIFLQI
jgi:hypothetical protein